MMMGGFGALKAMNDTIKLNREMLKAGKRQPFQKEFKKKSDGSLTLSHKEADENLIKMIRSSTIESERSRIKKSIVLLVLVMLLLASFALTILQG